MKKFAILSLVLFLTAALAPRAEAITFGLKAGLNSSKISLKTTDAGSAPNVNSVKGLTGGIYASLDLGILSIQPEVLYSSRGFQFAFEGETYTYDYKCDYIEVPILIKFNVLPAGPIKPFVFGGPSFGYLLKARATDNSVTPSESETITDSFKRTETAVVFGAGMDLGLPGIKASIDARYHLGLSSIQESNIEIESAKNRGFSVMVGIGF